MSDDLDQVGAHPQADRAFAATPSSPSVSPVPASIPCAGPDWRVNQPDGLEAAIAAFKREFPGWWYSVGECQVSCDASCAPTPECAFIKLIPHDDRFNSGFHADIPQPSTLAEALLTVMADAQQALDEVAPKELEARRTKKHEMVAIAMEARRAETGTGSVHDSAAIAQGVTR